MSDMTERDELRDKIANVLNDLDLVSEGIPHSPTEVADRILALLPAMPKLEWRKDGWGQDCCFIGNLKVGHLTNFGNFYASWPITLPLDERALGPFDGIEPARAAVEKAVKEALGWPE
mgnify:CR=1 FL=1